MHTKLLWIGTILAGAAAVLGVISTSQTDLNPMGAVAVGVAAIAFLYASNSVHPD